MDDKYQVSVTDGADEVELKGFDAEEAARSFGEQLASHGLLCIVELWVHDDPRSTLPSGAYLLECWHAQET